MAVLPSRFTGLGHACHACLGGRGWQTGCHAAQRSIGGGGPAAVVGRRRLLGTCRHSNPTSQMNGGGLAAQLLQHLTLSNTTVLRMADGR